MTTQTRAAARPISPVLPILSIAILGFGILFVAGHAQSNVLHDAAHDMRHATGLPCH
ncbi:CbtB-domain containing protein [Rhodobacteraceae bacterium 2CG4]|uniref:CbtB-domain containing protein n=1 Tax=Halovulum marinum TaxID=2662447 RepID=A0A6L5Z1M9_9RHOB|nr:CbtB domain-containing protein [Halovulum marinum]MSU90457.1 CbtB-domain containing protein [Halovulum marinum]